MEFSPRNYAPAAGNPQRPLSRKAERLPTAEQLLGAMAVLNSYAPALRFIGRVDPPIAHGLTLNDDPRAPKWFALAKDSSFKVIRASCLGYGFSWKPKTTRRRRW